MRVLLFSFLCLAMLPACLSKMEKVAEDTRDQVKTSLDRQTGSGVLELFDPHKDPSQKSAAFLRYITTPDAFPLNKMHVYMGMLKPITDKDFFVKNDTANVVYFGKRSVPRRLINPMSEETYETILTETLIILGALVKDKDVYSEYGRDVVIQRICTLAPHILGARDSITNRYYDQDPIKYTEPDSGEEKTLDPKYFRTQGATYLMKLTATNEVSDDLRADVQDRILRLTGINPKTLDLDIKYDIDKD